MFLVCEKGPNKTQNGNPDAIGTFHIELTQSS